MHQQPTLYKAKPLCDELAICRRTLTNWMREGRVPFIQTSPRCIRFDLAAVRAALEKFTVKSI